MCCASCTYQLIDHLLQQRARHEVLGMMLELEERQHRRSDQLVQSLQSELSVCCQQLTTTKVRVSMLITSVKCTSLAHAAYSVLPDTSLLVCQGTSVVHLKYRFCLGMRAQRAAVLYGCERSPAEILYAKFRHVHRLLALPHTFPLSFFCLRLFCISFLHLWAEVIIPTSLARA